MKRKKIWNPVVAGKSYGLVFHQKKCTIHESICLGFFHLWYPLRESDDFVEGRTWSWRNIMEIVPSLLECPYSLGTHTLSLFGVLSRDLMYLYPEFCPLSVWKANRDTSFHVFSNIFQRQAVLPGKFTLSTVATAALRCALVFSLEESSQDDFFDMWWQKNC